MKKGSKRKLEIQKASKELIIEKGYSAVTMSDIGQRINLSVGGLYYHYRSVEEIFLDLAANETDNVWSIFEAVNDIESLINVFRKYFKAEKKDLLNVENTLNSISYQYYFSFPAEIRKGKMQAAYTETIGKMTLILSKVFENPQTTEQLCNHIYVMLHGLNVLALTGQITEDIIDYEFKKTEILMRCLYSESEEVQ
ncbi:TetR/AcrR family transcriptional regulator [Paenibacillus sp. 22594]|uniref:TetR/AcrR family transcriptional regulator n=1 Tax=Paenibacillus sp. 22594 TaxID=3453947 RepID=UPI003F828C03